MSFIDSLTPETLAVVAPYLKPVKFAKGQCLVQEGDTGDGCYIIDEGEVRLELRHVETDSDGVLGYLGKGTVLGEFSLLDGLPRSASAYAQADTSARWFSKGDFEQLNKAHPAAGVEILNSLGRELSAKLRQQNRQLSEHLFSHEADADTSRTVAQATAAQQSFAKWSEDRVDALLQDIAATVADHAEMLAETNVADSGIGVAKDKVAKIRFACMEVCRTLVGKTASGPLAGNGNLRVVEMASPVGVVLGIIPVTNPVSTILFKTQVCLKGRNALILSCHRDAMRVGDMTGELIRSVLVKHQAPAELVQWIRKRTDRRKTMMYMRHPGVKFILATGGPSIVEAAYSSGTPAIGVGAGNAPVLVCSDADADQAASQIVQGKSFDNGVICGSENNLVVVKAIRTAFIEGLTRHGALMVSGDAQHRLTATLFDEEGHLRKDFVGKSATHIAQASGSTVSSDIRLLVVPVDREALAGPYGHEKLAPILSLFTVADEEEGIRVCRQILEQQGIGHTAVIHTTNETMARNFGAEMPASRILVNVPASMGCIGIGTGLTPSFTLGCGTDGGNSTTDNVTYTHLLNIKRLAFPG